MLKLISRICIILSMWLTVSDLFRSLSPPKSSLQSSTSSFGLFVLAYNPRVVRLCIASSDPLKLSSQCVLCDRRKFPLTVIDCTGYTKMNELTASLLSVIQATCLIYNCRKQLPNARPQPFYPSSGSSSVLASNTAPIMNILPSDTNLHQRYLSSKSATVGLPFLGSMPTPGIARSPLVQQPLVMAPYIIPVGYQRSRFDLSCRC